MADIGPLEAAYADMARAAGLSVMETRYLPSANVPFGYFATKRFDRTTHGRRQFNSVAGLLDLDWLEPSVGYRELLKVIRFITKQQSDVEAMIRRMIFNIAVHNRDDHTKQHAFFNDFNNTFTLTPSYDLTYSPGPGGEHYLSVNGRGKDIQLSDTLQLAREQRYPEKRCKELIYEVLQAATAFETFARRYEVSVATRAMVKKAIDRCAKLLV